MLELYRCATISSGKAAQLLGMSRFEFTRHASRLGIAFFDLTDDEWEAERAQSKSLSEKGQAASRRSIKRIIAR